MILKTREAAIAEAIAARETFVFIHKSFVGRYNFMLYQALLYAARLLLTEKL